MGFILENNYSEMLSIVLVFVTLVYIYYTWSFSYWRQRGVESVAAVFPFGSASSLFRRKTTFGELLKEIYGKYKKQGLRYVGFYLFAKPVLIALDINLIKSILAQDFHHFTDHGNYVNEEHEPLTGNLFGLKGQRWKHLRAKLTPTFTSGKMKMMFHTLVECSIGLREVMDDMVVKKEPVDIKDVVARYTTDVIGSCAFGLDCNSLNNPNSEFRQFGKKITQISRYEQFVRFLALVSPRIVTTLRLHFFNKELSNFIMKVVESTIDYREKNSIKRNDFMHLLIQLKNNVQLEEDENIEHLGESSKFSEGLTVKQIGAQAFVFFIGGFETSSTTLSFCFYELAINPTLQNTLRMEIKTVLQKHDGKITYDALMEMHYMDKCIQETLRKYPPLPLLLRECTETYTIPDSNVCIEKGTRVFIPSLGIQFDPEFYPNPENFDPERFSAENVANRDHFAWLPFGEGPRQCIGMRFGLMQTKVALTVLLKDYQFSVSSKTKTPLEMSPQSITTIAKDGIWLHATKLE